MKRDDEKPAFCVFAGTGAELVGEQPEDVRAARESDGIDDPELAAAPVFEVKPTRRKP